MTVTIALLLVFALEVAVSVTVPAAEGAVSVALDVVSALSVPPPATVQATPLSVESPETVALKFVLVPASIFADEGETATATDEVERPWLWFVEPPDELQPCNAARTMKDKTHKNKFFI